MFILLQATTKNWFQEHQFLTFIAIVIAIVLLVTFIIFSYRPIRAITDFTHGEEIIIVQTRGNKLPIGQKVDEFKLDVKRGRIPVTDLFRLSPEGISTELQKGTVYRILNDGKTDGGKPFLSNTNIILTVPTNRGQKITYA